MQGPGKKEVTGFSLPLLPHPASPSSLSQDKRSIYIYTSCCFRLWRRLNWLPIVSAPSSAEERGKWFAYSRFPLQFTEQQKARSSFPHRHTHTHNLVVPNDVYDFGKRMSFGNREQLKTSLMNLKEENLKIQLVSGTNTHSRIGGGGGDSLGLPC